MKKKKKELENSIQNKKLTLVQKFKFMKKSTINTQYNPTIFSKRTFSTAFSKKKNFSQILKNNIPTMDYNLINELIENKEKKKKNTNQDFKRRIKQQVYTLLESYWKFNN